MRPLRVMTVNLANGRALPGALARILDVADPHVVAAQELAPDSAAVLRNRFEHGLIQAGYDFQGRGLVSKVPLSAESLPLPKRDGLRGVLGFEFEPGTTTAVEVVAVHLTNPLERPVGSARQWRSRQVAALEALDGSGPRLVLGDMNASPAWPLYRSLRGLGADGARMAPGRTRRTWSLAWWQPAMLRIDHAFARDLTIRGVETHRIRGSDHRAVALEIVPNGSS